MSPRTSKAPMNFKTMAQLDVPQGRNGKHKQIVTRILADLNQVPQGIALKVPLVELAESKEGTITSKDSRKGERSGSDGIVARKVITVERCRIFRTDTSL